MEKERTYTIDEILKEAEEKRERKEREQKEAKEKFAREITEMVEGNKEDNQEEVVQTQSMGTPSKSEEQDEVEESIFKDEEKQKIELQRKTLGTNQEGLNKAAKSKKGKIATAIGVITTIGIMIIAGKSCSNNKDSERNMDNISYTTTTTTRVPETTVAEETTVVPETTVAEETTNAPETTVAEETTTTTTIEAINPDEIIVTKATEKTVVPETTVAEETTVVPETTVAEETTTSPVTEVTNDTTPDMVITETTTEAEKEMPVEIIPINIKNLDTKVAILKDTAELSGYLLSDELAINTIRVLHSDYIEHDGFDEITAQKYNDVLTVLTNIGSMNENLMNMSYITGQLKLSGKFYLPAAVFPEDIQSYMKEFNKITDEYVKALNDNQYIPGEVDYGALQNQSLEDQQRHFDEYQQAINDGEESIGIENFDEYLSLLEKAVNNEITDEAERIRLAELENENKCRKGREEAYNTYIKEVQVLINKPEYKDLASAKLGLLVNTTPVMLSGIDTNNYEITSEKVQNINEIITTSVDDIREVLIKQNRINNKEKNGQKIDQKEVLEAYVKEATERNEEESKLFSTIIDNIKEQATSYVKAR